MYSIDDRLAVSRPNDTHVLTLNLFCVDRPQLVMLTQDSYRRQYEPLDLDDFKAILEVVRPLKSIYVIFNCSEAGGCSRVHKHIQGLRGPPRAFEQIVQREPSQGDNTTVVPFQYFTHHFESTFDGTSASDMLSKYQDLLDKTRVVLGVDDKAVCPHNVVLWQDWMIVIPRRMGTVAKASANAGGMMGSVWVPDRDQVDAWIEMGPRKVLEELGVPWKMG